MSQSLQAARRGSGTAAEAHSELQRIEVGPDEAEMDMMPNYTNIHTNVLYNMKWQLPHKEFPGKKGIKWLSLLSAVSCQG